MKFINTDGMAFIGPGSEWFWTAVSGLVLAITFLAIYRKLRLQASAGAIEQIAALGREWRAEPMARSRVAILSAPRDGTDPADVPDRAAGQIGNFWEHPGYLVRAGPIDRRLVQETLGPQVGTWWAWLAPSTLRERERMHDPRNNEHFEWLAGLMAEMDRKAGVRQVYAMLNHHSDGVGHRARYPSVIDQPLTML